MGPLNKNLLLNISISIGSLIISFAILYGIYSFFFQKNVSNIHRPPSSEYYYSFFNQRGEKISDLDGDLKLILDPFTIYKHYPNQKTKSYSINEYGFRDGYTQDKDFNAMLLGGSAAFGFILDSNEKTFASKLSQSNDKYNIINSAVMGYLSGQELSQMIHYLDDFNPSLYIVFDGWNDIYDPYAFTKTWPVTYAPMGFNNAFFMIEKRLADFFDMSRKEKKIEKISIEPIRKNFINERIYLEYIIKTYTNNLIKMASFAKSRKAQFLLVIQPELGNKKERSKEEENILEDWNKKAQYLDRKISEKYRELRYQAKSIFDNQGIFTIDMNDVPEFSDDPRTLFLDVVHPNELGHEIIAAVLNRALSRLEQPHKGPESTGTSPAQRTLEELSSPCTLSFTKGWHTWEWGSQGHDWWRWTDGQGEVHLFMQHDDVLMLRGAMLSATQPNYVDVFVNAEKIVTRELPGRGFEPFEPIPLHLKVGENTLVFVSHRPAVSIPTDLRPLALAVKNLQVVGAEGVPHCDIQP